jgi:aminomethyltransferase
LPIRTTPFHPRTSALNDTALWSHWSGRLAAEKYQLSEKAEYVSVRNAAGLFDVSPLYKYRFSGAGAERFLAGVLARDPRPLKPGDAHYALWCDDRGFLVEDGVLLRHAPDEFVLTAAEPNLSYFEDLVGPRDDVRIEDISEDWAVLALQGPRSRGLLAALDPRIDKLAYFGHGPAKIGGHKVNVSRTGFTGDLGYEIWCRAHDALDVWDAVWAGTRGHGVIPFGLQALYMTRIEAGLLLLDVDFHNSRFAWTDADRATPLELGLGWALRDLATTDRIFIGRDALRREQRDGTSRFRTTGIVVDYSDWNRHYEAAGLLPEFDHTPIQEEQYLYDEVGAQVGYATSFLYSPVLQRHVGIARVPAELAAPGSRVFFEYPINHRYVHLAATTARLPHFNPQRKTA